MFNKKIKRALKKIEDKRKNEFSKHTLDLMKIIVAADLQYDVENNICYK